MDARRSTAVGLVAVVLWSGSVGLIRSVSEAFGATLGGALVYTVAAAGLWVTRPPLGTRRAPVLYLVTCGGLFVFYEAALALALGLADTADQAIEVGLVNYLWPSLTVLAAAATAPAAGRGRRVARVLPGVLLAALGAAWAVGGDAGLSVSGIAANVASNPVPYVLALGAAVSWAIYSVLTPRIAAGHDGITVFMTATAAALWALLALGGDALGGAPVDGVLRGASAGDWVMVIVAGAVMAAGYACWNVGILGGDVTILGVASYFTPVLSVLVALALLDATLSAPFWVGVALVVGGSLASWWATRITPRRRPRTG